uniref:Uncharacterized protein n=1 Tax=Cryptomonas curvata TaxID=233186 RepID=A0A7S0QDX3_9CRYP|mmetsp:Transcript_14489/g.30991  ORF Transcript_14489/g.30991 Transcript_14489/m.30991 type:complete len:196 (+) Transcript_14489:189-776(+)
MLQTIAQVSGYMVYTEITCYVNMNVPDPSEFEVDHALLMIWGLFNVFGILLHLFLMVIATMLFIAVLQVSAHEGPEGVGLLHENDYYSKTGNPDGVVMTEEQFLSIWDDRYEVWFRRLILLFSWGTAMFFATLIPTAHVRYFMNSTAAWIQCGALFMALVLWARIHNSIVPSLLHCRPGFQRTSSRAASPSDIMD